MIILDKPYVSPLLEETVIENGYYVLNNDAAKELKFGEKMNLLSDKEAGENFRNSKDGLLYSNSENSINWIAQNLSFSDLPQKIELFKDKVKFRELLSKIYPDFYFKEVNFDDLKKLDADTLKMPLVLKPAVGFLSMGVYVIQNKDAWNDALKNLECDIERFKGQFPIEVVDSSKFIIEEMIEGEEFAIDAYFDCDGKPVILNIFSHPFSGDEDVSDRVYFTSKEVILSWHDKFEKLLSQIGELSQMKNFPLHMEVRVSKEQVVPIEINPMRFAGWCVTDLAYFAYGINVYEYYFSQKRPDWNEILKDKDEEFYYFTIAEVPCDVDKKDIKDVDYDAFLSNIKCPLEIRKIDFSRHPIFAIVFAKTQNQEEMQNLLKDDMHGYIKI